MSVSFATLPEFVKAREENNIDLSTLDKVLDKLDFSKLNALLTGKLVSRVLALKKWLKQVGQVCDIAIRIKISLRDIKPYMTEKGKVCICLKDMRKASYTFFAAAHETAHFILLRDEDYDRLKVLDREYPQDSGDKDLLSPIEYCANVTTLNILNRCLVAEGDGAKRDKIIRYISELKKVIY